MTDHEPRDLDALLSTSAPPTSPDGPERVAALEAMARDARPTRRRVRRPLAIGAGALALVLAGGAAAAAAFDWPVPWAVTTYSFTLPSGATCETAVGNLQGPPDAVAAAEEFLTREDLLDVIDLDAALADIEAGPRIHVLADGTEVDAGPGTEYWMGADLAYLLAYARAVGDALGDYLVAQGYDDSGVGLEGVLNCPDRELPDWMDLPGE